MYISETGSTGNYTAGDKFCNSYLGSHMTGALTGHSAHEILRLWNARMKVATLCFLAGDGTSGVLLC